MTKKDYFYLKKDYRDLFIEKCITSQLLTHQQNEARIKINNLIDKFEGIDTAAASLLACAAKNSRFNEFFNKLNRHYNENIRFIHPKQRLLGIGPRMLKAKVFFDECYKELDIYPRR